MDRTLLNMARTILEEKSVSNTFWPEAINIACYFINRITSSSPPTDTAPHQRLLSYKPHIAHLETFCSSCCYNEYQQTGGKLQSRGKPSILIVYVKNRRVYGLWDSELSKAITLRDVQFEQVRTVNTTELPRHDCTELPLVDTKKIPPATETSGRQLLEDDINQPLPAHSEQSEPPEIVSSALHRSAHIKKKPGEWWKASSASAVFVQLPESKLTYFRTPNGEERGY